jgi:hypothetical protein
MLRERRITSDGEIPNGRLRALYKYWNKKKGERRAPGQAEIDPIEIPELLGFVNLYDVRQEPRDYLVRLNGSEVAAMLGQDITGMWCSRVISGEDGERCHSAFAMCVDDWSPALVETSLSFCGKDHAAQLLLALPLSDDGETVNKLMTAHAYKLIGMSAESWDEIA